MTDSRIHDRLASIAHSDWRYSIAGGLGVFIGEMATPHIAEGFVGYASVAVVVIFATLGLWGAVARCFPEENGGEGQ